ncbi:MFS transporter [Chitinophaga arvensicola]|uniref:Predicted arabinose efflux permease, MFS family n=1 Tax=Chitinophaga arvensicola TaxID=29529 RepID=A0A1I0S540_9BACT|nr:MFS transporter [Chitinophaga arvensicola]SEW49812.1 Predicted arabinose efflux permease, MFS family [Chitinophaga arvensicola]
MKQVSSLVEYGFRRAFITLTAIICILLPVMNITVADVAFADIKGQLGVPAYQVHWVTIAYVLGQIIIIPFSNLLSSKLGRRNYLVGAILLFTVCSFFCGNAASIYELTIFRFLQGLGGGGMLVLSHITITESWPVEKRATSQAFVIFAMLVGPALTAPFAGYLTDNYSWPFVFFANIPAGIIIGLLAFMSVRNVRYEKQEYASGVWQNTQLRIGILLSFVAALGRVCSSFTDIPSLSQHTASVINPVWLAIAVLTGTLLLTVFLMEKGMAMKYMIAAGLLLLLIACYLTYQGGSVDFLWRLTIRGIAVTSLFLSIDTFALSQLEGKQIGQGVALYNLALQLAGGICMVLFPL